MENGPVEIVDFPIKNCHFPWQNVSSPEGMGMSSSKIDIYQNELINYIKTKYPKIIVCLGLLGLVTFQSAWLNVG